MKAENHAGAVIAVFVLLGAFSVIVFLAYNAIVVTPGTINSTTVPFALNGSSQTTSASTSIPSTTSINLDYSGNKSIVAYTLALINSERLQYGLQNVVLSNESSGQQHANSMILGYYFSHWDPYGMKPYMRYTLLGGTQSVDENVAYREYAQETCTGSYCQVNPINVTNSISFMENQMLYNDSQCCNNGHRLNILDPNHNQISIGVGYNDTTVYLVEDFINDYVNWFNSTPRTSGDNVYLIGNTTSGTQLDLLQITYDPLPQNLTRAQLDHTDNYSYGKTIAGVTHGNYYYQNITNLYATRYQTKGDYFSIEFNMSQLIKMQGAGAYTVMVYLTNSTGQGFLGSTYTVFVGNNLQPFAPQNV